MYYLDDIIFEGDKRIVYGDGATFVPKCVNCCRYVKPDDKVLISEAKGLSKETNATCKKCGRTHMVFEGFI